MNKILSVVLVIALICVGGYFAYSTFVMSETQGDISDTANQANINSCKSMKQTLCTSQGSISEDDYSQSCFQNGEHILDNPYTCKG
jgi:hypothetical protein